jgi:hypothetical protein
VSCLHHAGGYIDVLDSNRRISATVIEEHNAVAGMDEKETLHRTVKHLLKSVAQFQEEVQKIFAVIPY